MTRAILSKPWNPSLKLNCCVPSSIPTFSCVAQSSFFVASLIFFSAFCPKCQSYPFSPVASLCWGYGWQLGCPMLLLQASLRDGSQQLLLCLEADIPHYLLQAVSGLGCCFFMVMSSSKGPKAQLWMEAYT